MNFKFWKKDKPEERQLTNSFDYLLYNSSGSYATSKALLLSAVYKCEEVISDSIAQLPLEPFKVVSRGYKVKYDSHPTYNA